MNRSSPQQCVDLDCDRRPRYHLDTGEPGGVGQAYVCRGHIEDVLFTREMPGRPVTFLVTRLT